MFGFRGNGKPQLTAESVVSCCTQIQRKWDQDKLDPEKQPALEENNLKPSDGETLTSDL